MSSKIPGQRQLKVGEQIKRIMAEIFIEDHNTSVPNVHITIIKADVSPDIKNCKILLNIFGTIDKAQLIRNLNNNIGYFRNLLSAKIKLRHTPELLFVLDSSGNNTSRINELLASESEKFTG